MSSDERLSQRAATGDQRAFEEIYRRYHQDLYRFCLAIVGNPQDAQDTLQNTMVKALRALPGERRKIRLKPWLYRIARNEAVETLRKRRGDAELEPQQAAVPTVAEAAETRDRLRTLLADLEQLPERQRAALVMRELSGLDFDQIGSAFESSAAVARQTLYEARLSLRQLEAGREMRCADVKRKLSNADGRVTRRREIRAHLRSCADCRAFQDEIAQRRKDLAALAPLPLATSAGLLHSVLGAKAGATAGAITTSALAKSAATVAVVSVVAVSAADRSGVIDLPFPGRDRSSPAQGSSGPRGGRTESAAGPAGGQALPTIQREGTRVSQLGTSERAGGDGNEGHGGPPLEAAAGRESSASQAGEDPPGGGYGRSAKRRGGRPGQLPTASDKGQQNAAAHKSDHAAPPSGTERGNGKSSGAGPPAVEPTSPPKAKAPAAASPSAKPPSQLEGGTTHSGPDGTPLGLER